MMAIYQPASSVISRLETAANHSDLAVAGMKYSTWSIWKEEIPSSHNLTMNGVSTNYASSTKRKLTYLDELTFVEAGLGKRLGLLQKLLCSVERVTSHGKP